jgi:uncharacterized protein (DUF433 family)
VTTVETRYEHIVLRDGKVPEIAGTTMKVIELVTAQQAYGWSPDELAFQHPYLTMGQIHSALAYYWDHQAELDEDIARRLARVDELRAQTPEPPIVARLRAIKYG